MRSVLAIFFVLLLRQQCIGGVVEAGDDFIRVNGCHFVANGSPFFANGFNAYWLMSVASDPSQRDKVSDAFREAISHGLAIARTWAFSDGGPTALQQSPGSYNELMFKGLDFVVAEARKYKIRLILSLANNFENFGGKKQYVEWAREQGQSIGSEDDFFTNPVVKGYYKNHVKAVLTRYNTITGVAYKDDPTIFAWELMNEPRCPSDLSGNCLQSWITEMAAYVKSIDSNHLLEAGLEGFYDFQVGTDFISHHQIPGIDFATFHSYPDNWMANTTDAVQLLFISKWFHDHIQDADNILKKPLLLTEFGESLKGSGYNNSLREVMLNTIYTKIYTSARTGGASAGGLFWHFLIPGMDNYRDGYEIVFNENPSMTNIITIQAWKLHYLSKLYARIRITEKGEVEAGKRNKEEAVAGFKQGKDVGVGFADM